MSKVYRVADGLEFEYPADEATLTICKHAGGRSKVSKETLSLLKFKTVVAGDDCSDMPAESLATYLSRGWLLEEEQEDTEGDK